VLFRVKFKFRVSDIFSTARKETKLLFITFDLNDCVSSRLSFWFHFHFTHDKKKSFIRNFFLYSSSPGKKKRKIEFTALTLWGWVQFSWSRDRSSTVFFFFLYLVYTFAPRFITNQFSSHTYAAAQVYVFPKHSGPLTNNTVKLTRKKERIKTTRQLLKRGMCLSRKSSRRNQKLSVRFIRCRKRISFSTLGDSFKIPALCVFQSCPIVLCVLRNVVVVHVVFIGGSYFFLVCISRIFWGVIFLFCFSLRQ
jgi:hypothetical protein